MDKSKLDLSYWVQEHLSRHNKMPAGIFVCGKKSYFFRILQNKLTVLLEKRKEVSAYGKKENLYDR